MSDRDVRLELAEWIAIEMGGNGNSPEGLADALIRLGYKRTPPVCDRDERPPQSGRELPEKNEDKSRQNLDISRLPIRKPIEGAHLPLSTYKFYEGWNACHDAFMKALETHVDKFCGIPMDSHDVEAKLNQYGYFKQPKTDVERLDREKLFSIVLSQTPVPTTDAPFLVRVESLEASRVRKANITTDLIMSAFAHPPVEMISVEELEKIAYEQIQAWNKTTPGKGYSPQNMIALAIRAALERNTK